MSGSQSRMKTRESGSPKEAAQVVVDTLMAELARLADSGFWH